MFNIDNMAREPVYEQIIEQTERFILAGVLHAGDQMQSVRSLSLELSVNPNTVLKSYAIMESRGLLRSVPGKGYFVAETSGDVLRSDAQNSVNELKDMITQMKNAGIAKQEILDIVHTVYAGPLRSGGEVL